MKYCLYVWLCGLILSHLACAAKSFSTAEECRQAAHVLSSPTASLETRFYYYEKCIKAEPTKPVKPMPPITGNPPSHR